MLVGGFGTRLRPLTLTTPKQMLPLGHRPMIEWVVGHLAEHGVARGDPVARLQARRVHRGVSRRHVQRGAHPLRGRARTPRHRGCDPVRRTRGRHRRHVSRRERRRAHRPRRRHAGAFPPRHGGRRNDPSHAGRGPVDVRRRADRRRRPRVAFIEKPPATRRPRTGSTPAPMSSSPQCSTASPAIAGCRSSGEVFPRWPTRAVSTRCSTDDYWLDTGTPQQYLQANLDLLGGRGTESSAVSRDAVIDPTATVVHRFAHG